MATTRYMKKKVPSHGEVMRRAGAALANLTAANAALKRALVEERTREVAAERVLFIKTYGAHSQTVFVTDRAAAEEMLEHLTCGLVRIIGFDERRMAVKELKDRDDALAFFG